jgi:hypothetical protein
MATRRSWRKMKDSVDNFRQLVVWRGKDVVIGGKANSGS